MNSADKMNMHYYMRILRSTNSNRVGDAQQADKASEFFIIKIDGITLETCNLLESKIQTSGLHSAKSNSELPSDIGGCSLTVSGTASQFLHFNISHCDSESTLTGLKSSLLEVIDNYHKSSFILSYPGGQLDLTTKTAIMGVVNVTPDSFSDGGDYFSTDKAVKQALVLAEQGADILDIGGESTRPGSNPLDTKEEIDRVIPVIKDVSSKVSIPVSVDTYKPAVAREALNAGAKIVNDVTGLTGNGEMADIVASHGAPLIVMHMKGKPKSMQNNPVYRDLILEIYARLSQSIQKATSLGIEREKLIIDPGIGFGKTFEDNLVILDRLHEFKSLGLPICIGVSRKAFIGATLGKKQPKERLTGSLSAGVIAVRGGARIVRVHDVRETAEAIRMADAVAAGSLPQEA